MSRMKAMVLGATGMMGQKFVTLLADHPWFEVSAVAASDRSIGKSYSSAIGSKLAVPDGLGEMQVVDSAVSSSGDPDIVFSALPTEIAGRIEDEFAQAGYPVFTNASPHRMDRFVPLLNPEVNGDHASLVEQQKKHEKRDGFIVANPNCTTAVLTVSLKPLHDMFDLDTVIVSSMQAVSGAGYPGVASMDILGNVVPYIKNEEEKVETETNKMLGTSSEPTRVNVSASCHRVPTLHGHIEAVFVKMKKPASPGEASGVMRDFVGLPQKLRLPSAPANPIVIRSEDDRPQTRLDVDEGNGMSVSVGRIRKDDALHGLKYIVLGHNLMRGGAGCSILNAELFQAEKLL
jgi:aspartate-semialdehyde dehydrogenase